MSTMKIHTFNHLLIFMFHHVSNPTTAGSGQPIFANMIFLEAITTDNFSVHKNKVLLNLYYQSLRLTVGEHFIRKQSYPASTSAKVHSMI
jgi:hypothetical protein